MWWRCCAFGISGFLIFLLRGGIAQPRRAASARLCLLSHASTSSWKPRISMDTYRTVNCPSEPTFDGRCTLHSLSPSKYIHLYPNTPQQGAWRWIDRSRATPCHIVCTKMSKDCHLLRSSSLLTSSTFPPAVCRFPFCLLSSSSVFCLRLLVFSSSCFFVLSLLDLLCQTTLSSGLALLRNVRDIENLPTTKT